MIGTVPLGLAWRDLDPRTWSMCDIPNVVTKVPVVRDAVKRFGCHPAGRAAAVSYLATSFGPGAIGLNVAVNCICDQGIPGAGRGTLPEKEPEPSFFRTPVGVATLAAGAFALTMALRG